MGVSPVATPALPQQYADAADIPAIEIDGVSRRYGAIEALRGVSLAVRPGEIPGLLGPNGAGKTTLVRILGGLADPTSGDAWVLDRRAGRSRELHGAIGLVPSGDRTFYLRISGRENLIFFARLHGLRRRAAGERADAVLEAVGLTDAAGRAVMTYSHGMQKRLSFARALLGGPSVLLVDEATHDLDPVAAQRVRALTPAEAARGRAVLWATQRLEELTGFADAVTVLERGTVRFEGSVAALAAHARTDRHVLRLREPCALVLDAQLGTLEPAPDG